MLCESLFWYCVNLYCAFIYESSMQPETLIAIWCPCIIACFAVHFFLLRLKRVNIESRAVKKNLQCDFPCFVVAEFLSLSCALGLFECVDANMKGNENKLNNIEIKNCCIEILSILSSLILNSNKIRLYCCSFTNTLVKLFIIFFVWRQNVRETFAHKRNQF